MQSRKSTKLLCFSGMSTEAVPLPTVPMLPFVHTPLVLEGVWGNRARVSYGEARWGDSLWPRRGLCWIRETAERTVPSTSGQSCTERRATSRDKEGSLLTFRPWLLPSFLPARPYTRLKIGVSAPPLPLLRFFLFPWTEGVEISPLDLAEAHAGMEPNPPPAHTLHPTISPTSPLRPQPPATKRQETPIVLVAPRNIDQRFPFSLLSVSPVYQGVLLQTPLPSQHSLKRDPILCAKWRYLRKAASRQHGRVQEAEAAQKLYTLLLVFTIQLVVQYAPQSACFDRCEGVICCSNCRRMRKWRS